MLCGVKVLGRMLVLGAIAAAHMSADQAQAQMHPAIAHPQTLFAPVGAGGHFADLIQVGAVGRHQRIILNVGHRRYRALAMVAIETLDLEANRLVHRRLHQHSGQTQHVRDDDIGLVRRHAEGAGAAIDESCIHASGLCADAIERMIRDE